MFKGIITSLNYSSVTFDTIPLSAKNASNRLYVQFVLLITAISRVKFNLQMIDYRRFQVMSLPVGACYLWNTTSNMLPRLPRILRIAALEYVHCCALCPCKL